MSQEQGYNYMNSGSQHYIDPNGVPLSNALECSCTCANTQTPNITAYLYTLPSFTCFQWQLNCLSNGTDISSPLFNACRSVQCGTLDAAVATTTIFPTSPPALGSSTLQNPQQLNPNARAGLGAGLGVAALFSLTAIVLMWFWHRRPAALATPSRNDSSLETQVNTRPMSAPAEIQMRRASVNGLDLTTVKKPFVAAADVIDSPGGSPPRPSFGHGNGNGNVNGRGSDVSRDGRPMSHRKGDVRKLEARESRMVAQSTEEL
ncbi:hypothetical protein LTR78_002929 [Recurvomyces mirabilis]|uniref:DUF7707 domain-containing protein n=1 Tax=Recurvomyces mirabilis TaxID=574656 RepID=A0AAE1C436_9PEZI|nr:hypothetical protein LTR78_002929 [Recurvomyces mirabilis]KAK5159337.1 hypothetical protein LTS14_002479 [Recurvomyces mirabilis]